MNTGCSTYEQWFCVRIIVYKNIKDGIYISYYYIIIIETIEELVISCDVLQWSLRSASMHVGMLQYMLYNYNRVF